MRKMKISREDRWDAEEHREPKLGASICEGKGDATRQLSSGEARASRHLFSFSFCESPAPGKTHLNMANPSCYIRLLAPAHWRLVEVPMEGCPPSREGRSPYACSACSVPEPGMTHCARMSVHNSQQPQTAAISCLCQTNRISSVARRSPDGAAPHRMHSDILWATHLCEPPRSRALPEAVRVLFIRSNTRWGGPVGRLPHQMEQRGLGNWLAGLCRGIFKRKQAPTQETSTADEGTGLRGLEAPRTCLQS